MKEKFNQEEVQYQIRTVTQDLEYFTRQKERNERQMSNLIRKLRFLTDKLQQSYNDPDIRGLN